MAPKKPAAATSDDGEIDDGDACRRRSDDIQTLLSCSIAAAMLLPDPGREPKPLDLDERDGGHRSEGKKASKRKKEEEGDDAEEELFSTPQHQQQQRPPPPPPPLTADDHAFFLAAEATLATAGGSLSRASELRWQRLRPRFAAERAAWWARARTPACSAAWTATAPTWRSSCRRRPAPGSGAGWRCCCCAAAAAAATAMSLPQSDLAGFHCFA